jgi:nucleoside-diphosphate-sugar epimerase
MILVLGGTGFIGLHTVQALAAYGEPVVATSYRRSRGAELLATLTSSGQVTVEPTDLTSRAAVQALFAKHRPDSVIDVSGYPPKELAPADEVRKRVSAWTNFLEAAQETGSRVTLLSSMDTYWGLSPEHLPYQEDQPVPVQERADTFITQAWAKKAYEVIGSLFARQAGLRIRTVRAGGVYGPYYRTMLNLPSRLAVAALRGAEPDFSPAVGGRPVGTAGYDLAYVKDIARGIALVHFAQDPAHDVYNIGAGRAVTNDDIARAVEAAVAGFHVELAPAAEAAPVNIWMDISRAAKDLGYRPQYSPADAVADYVEWLRHHDI